MSEATTKQLKLYCTGCKQVSKVSVTIRSSHIPEDLLYSWVCPVCKARHLAVVFGKNDGKEEKGVSIDL